jgi:hypothetical protein
MNDTTLWGGISYDFGLPLLSLMILLFMLLLMVYFFYKVKKFLPCLLVYMFSLIFGLISIGEYNIPFTPWLQIFFLCFQSMFILFATIKWRRMLNGTI